MAFIEEQIEKYQKRVQKIKERPDPRRLNKANLAYYEAELKHYRHQLKVWHEGRPFADGESLSFDLLRAMGFEICDLLRAADRLSVDKAASLFERVRALGYPDYACDRTVLFIPMVIDSKELPKPSLLVTTSGCEALDQCEAALSDELNIAHFHIDVPKGDNYKEYLGYITDQLRELVAFAETAVPGVKFSEERLAEYLEYERMWYEAFRDIYELLKRVPCSAHPRDIFREPRWPCNSPDPRWAVEYMQMFRDELREKAEQGYSPVAGEEKLRLLWAVTGPYYGKIWEWLLERGVSVPFWYYSLTPRVFGLGRYPTIGDTTEFGRKLTPLEEVARNLTVNTWSGHARRWVEHGVMICRDLKVDGIVSFDQVGCVPVQYSSQLLAASAEKELGIPALSIAGRQLDPTYLSEDEMVARLDEFVNLCLRTKGY